jgi:sodium-dependent dicarboxylate transporter 2/3/5
MDSMAEFLSYLALRLPLILTFSSGYIVYLLLVNTKLTDFFILWNLKRSRGNLSSLIAYILVIGTLLSFFIPNAVTILCLLPFLKSVKNNLTHNGPAVTVLTLSAIYGANIGGMGSIIGSPANLLLIGALDFYRIPGREQVNFFSWFIWALPLTVILCAIAWILLTRFVISGRMRESAVKVDSVNQFSRPTSDQRRAGMLFVFFVCFWIADGFLDFLSRGFKSVEPYACIGFFMSFVYLTFIKSYAGRHSPLLYPKDLLRHLPKRGLIFLGIVILLIPLFRWFGWLEKAVLFVTELIPRGDYKMLIIIAITLAVIFLTEIFSNTVVAAAFFTIAYYLAPAQNINPLILMICISTASTCAFMTPIATPCNALAFGEMKGTSLSKMLVLGLPMNIASAFSISFWLQFIIPRIYG